MSKTVYDNLASGDRVAFGNYPQRAVADEGIVSKAVEICGEPPCGKLFKRKSSLWTEYDNCWGSGCICDFACDGKNYRGVYTKTYNEGGTFYKLTGYLKGRIYAFVYEPVEWRVLRIDDGKALLLSEAALDVRCFSEFKQKKLPDGSVVYSNNYEHSDIRTWLNGTFFDTVFTDDEKSRVVPTAVENGEETTKRSPNRYACADTVDRVFPLSFRDALTLFADNKARWKKATEYAKAQGCYAYGTHDAKYNNTCWWLRSPDRNYCNCVRCVGDGGGLGDGGFSASNEPASAAEGVAPAIVVRFGGHI